MRCDVKPPRDLLGSMHSVILSFNFPLDRRVFLRFLSSFFSIMPRTQRTGGKRGVHHDPQKIQQAVEAVKNGNTVREAHGKNCDRVLPRYPGFRVNYVSCEALLSIVIVVRTCTSSDTDHCSVNIGARICDSEEILFDLGSSVFPGN